jgi:nucleotide-binding universal stress UspA family protein
MAGAAKKHQCDLIVMSMHGYATLDRMLPGSETNRVMGGCDVPVLVCR